MILFFTVKFTDLCGAKNVSLDCYARRMVFINKLRKESLADLRKNRAFFFRFPFNSLVFSLEELSQFVFRISSFSKPFFGGIISFFFGSIKISLT